MYVGTSLADVYQILLDEMLGAEPVEGYKDTTAEILNASIVITEPNNNLLANKGRRFNYRYQVAEMLWNAQPCEFVSLLSYVFPGVTKYVEDQPEDLRDIANWSYGRSVSAGLCTCFDELTRDPESRRAVIRVEVQHPFVPGTPPCLVSIQFMARQGKLHAFVNMRSNDVWRGFPLDVYQFSMWQLIMASALRLEVGHYYHTAATLHLYERDRLAIEKFIAEETSNVRSTTPDVSALTDFRRNLVGESMSTRRLNTELQGIRPWLACYFGIMDEAPPEFQYLLTGGYGVW
jgi:thymidylate synthase